MMAQAAVWLKEVEQRVREVMEATPELKQAAVERIKLQYGVKAAAYAQQLFICHEMQPGVDGGDEAYAEGVVDEVRNIRRKLWRIEHALEWIKPGEKIAAKVGNVLWRLTEKNREVGCGIWVAWLKGHGVSDEDARAVWAEGFPEWAWADEVYEAAQREGWRFVITSDPNRFADVVERSEAALVRIGADIYQAGGELVRPVSEMVDATKGRKTRIARLQKIEGPFLTAELTRYVDYVKWDENDCRKPSGVPPGLVGGILSRYGEWKFRPVAGVICAPTLRRDGTVLDTEGYDEATGLFVMGPLPEMRVLAQRPTKADAESALTILGELLVEFPFVDRASRSVALSGFLTTVCRPALGCVPLHASTAPVAGTGKSFLFDLISGVANGDAMPVIAAGGSLEEMAKRFDAQVIKGFTMLSIDNVSFPIGGDELCQVIERPAYTPRILGQSKMKERRNIWTMFATGNNLRLRDDVTRRALLSRLDAKMERPETRPFKGDPFEAVLRNRGRYLWAALTIVLAYRAAGMPGQLPRIGDPFAEWSDQVRSALVWLGQEDPVLSMEAVRENDPSRQARIAMFQAIHNAYGSEAKTGSQMIADAKAGSLEVQTKDILKRRRSVEAENLQAAIIQYTSDRMDARYLGNKFGTDRGAIADGLRLCSKYDAHTKVHYWYVEAADTPSAGED